jgi:Fic family protein/DNA-binding MarR family transcriptional regulator
VVAEGAFLPDPLRSEVALRQETYRLAADAQEALGRLDMGIRRVPNLSRWVRHALRAEARSSAAFDGVVTLPQEVYVAGLPGAPAVDARLDRYLRACTIAVDAARGGRPIDVALLGRLSAVVSGTSQDAEPWRTVPGWVGGPRSEDAYLVAAPPGPELQVATEQWCSWVEEQREMPLLVKITLAYFQFSVLSPFPGAAHLARLVITYELLRSGALAEPALPISAWMRRHHQMLPKLVRGVVDRKDFDALVTFLATGVRETCEAEIARITTACETYAGLVAQFSRKTAMVHVLEALVADPAMDLQEIAETCDVTPTHAATLARQLEKAEIVQVLDSKTLEQRAKDNSYRKVIQLTPRIKQLLSLDLHPGTTGLDRA